MLAIVCKTYEGVKALEKYDNKGMIDKTAGLHGLGLSIGRLLDGRFRVICLENLRLDLNFCVICPIMEFSPLNILVLRHLLI